MGGCNAAGFIPQVPSPGRCRGQKNKRMVLYMFNNDKEIENRINKEIDTCGMAYKIKDRDGNKFVFAGLENGFPVYRSRGGQSHIFDLRGYEVIEKYCIL